MTNLQQQKAAIDAQAQKTKDEADRTATQQRQAAADEESKKVRQTAEEEVAKIQYDAQR
ncbi:MAG: hypothetical protein UU12_C0020G0024 [Candidatus Woesebacteria bacterium GW2011_GWA2_40_7b]|uniref:Uncharacterized protein n=1 Tax=Candidatus Woesebacteria bacterium GW2011_GWA2_40_7b TaxID=1618563 RepID=A0A0G0T0A7_9BACT|nr:MAG: hypothetical protein UU12_C0020G0024 [Candidatus Woesebacteria bacterium GW2011_GWA2_40_7b]